MDRRLTFLIVVYVGLPGVLIAVALIAWMAAVENATLVLQSADSPDGRYRAQVVREDPGVSSNYEYMVRIAPANLTPLAERLRLLLHGSQYIPLDMHREPDKLLVQWSSSQQLTIRCEGCAGAAPGRAAWRDIRITYELK